VSVIVEWATATISSLVIVLILLIVSTSIIVIATWTAIASTSEFGWLSLTLVISRHLLSLVSTRFAAHIGWALVVMLSMTTMMFTLIDFSISYWRSALTSWCTFRTYLQMVVSSTSTVVLLHSLMSLLILILSFELMASSCRRATTLTIASVYVGRIVLDIFLVLMRCNTTITLVMIFFALFILACTLVSWRAFCGTTTGTIAIVVTYNLSGRSFLSILIAILLILSLSCHLLLSSLISGLRERGDLLLKFFVASACNGPEIIRDFIFSINKVL